MQRFAKVLLGSAAAVALISGVMTLSTTQASAQIDIEGMIRGAMAHGYHGGHYRGRHGRVHETRRGRHSKEHEAKDDDSGKDKHPGDNGDQVNNKPDRRQFSSHPKDTPQSEASNPPPAPAAPQSPQQQPDKGSGDVPSFTPEK